MTTHKFNPRKTGELKARFHAANINVSITIRQQRDLAAQLEAEMYLYRLFAQYPGIRPQ